MFPKTNISLFHLCDVAVRSDWWEPGERLHCHPWGGTFLVGPRGWTDRQRCLHPALRLRQCLVGLLVSAGVELSDPKPSFKFVAEKSHGNPFVLPLFPYTLDENIETSLI